MNYQVLQDYWVTVLVEYNRTRDVRITTRSIWSAGWLLKVLQPQSTILHVRPTNGPAFSPQQANE